MNKFQRIHRSESDWSGIVVSQWNGVWTGSFPHPGPGPDLETSVGDTTKQR